jgi:hypothetical protein
LSLIPRRGTSHCMQQQTFNQQERELGQSISRATPAGQSFDRAMAVDQGEALTAAAPQIPATDAAADKAAVPSKKDKAAYAAAGTANLLRKERNLLETYLARKDQRPVAENVKKALLNKRQQIAEAIKASDAALVGGLEEAGADKNQLDGVLAEAIRRWTPRLTRHLPKR